MVAVAAIWMVLRFCNLVLALLSLILLPLVAGNVKKLAILGRRHRYYTPGESFFQR
jgi:hypothetical protein